MCYTQNAQQIPGPSGQKGENATSILGDQAAEVVFRDICRNAFVFFRTRAPGGHSDERQAPQRGLWEWQKFQSPETEQPLDGLARTGMLTFGEIIFWDELSL